jgi:hypothetical protein
VPVNPATGGIARRDEEPFRSTEVLEEAKDLILI